MSEPAADVVCPHDNIVSECWRCKEQFQAMQALGKESEKEKQRNMETLDKEIKKEKDSNEQCGNHPVVRKWCGCERRGGGAIRVHCALYKREDVVAIELEKRGSAAAVIKVQLKNLLHGDAVFEHYFSSYALGEQEFARIESKM